MGTDIALALVMVFIMLNKLKVLVLNDEPDPYTGKTRGNGSGRGNGDGYGNGNGYGGGDGYGYGDGDGNGTDNGTGGLKQDEDISAKR